VIAPRRPPDLRAIALAAFAWAGGLCGFLLPPRVTFLLGCLAGLHLVVRRLRGRPVLVRVAWFVAAGAVAGASLLRTEAVVAGPVAGLAAEEAYVSAVVTVVSDPLLREGRFGTYAVVRTRTVEVTGRGARHRGRVPLLVVGGEQWSEVELGSVVGVQGRLAPADGPQLAGVLSTSRTPALLAEPARPLDGAAAVRAGIRRAVAGAGDAERSLVPALVVGDDRGMPDGLVSDFRTSGLTHLLAVSGTNLTLVVGFLLIVARWLRVRARGLLVTGLLGVVGFVLLARTEPSVVRAAAMGSIALLGLSSNGREKGTRALGVAVVVLLLFEPSLALSVGFTLSVLATAGILFLGPPWRDALCRWLPRWAAEAVSVPLAAQLACTPVVAAISDQVSLVAVVANMIAAPAVGPATVLGLAGGLLVLVLPALGELVGRLAGACAWWIIATAQRSAELPTAAVDWEATAGSLAVLTVVCVGIAALVPGVLHSPRRSMATALVMLLLVVRPLPTPGWPPDGWVLVACDVGQGDGLVLNAGGDSVVLVDVGPDPRLVADCLDRLEVQRVEAVVLTHFHHDHVAGLPGVLATWRPAEVLVTPLADPVEGAEAVVDWAERHDVPVRVPSYGEVRRTGQLTWQVVGPDGRFGSGRARAEGSAANNASLVLLAETRGVRMLLTGDVEPEAQVALLRSLAGLQVDVLKVPHHGSGHQDAEFLAGLGARLAVVSTGEDNDYGHPAPGTLAVLERAGMHVARTDESGDVAVVVRAGQLVVRELRTSSSAMR
jgi:competence protein ComEC